ACTLGADFKAIRNAVREFAGVEHRLEFVATLRGVAFYNDSKATSVDAAAKALSTFERGVHLIVGGTDKGAPYTPLAPLIQERVKSVYLIGAAAEKIAADLAGADLHPAGNLKAAVKMAFQRAISGDVVLLSPACSSYDQFHDFEERGRAFKEAVEHLAKTPLVEVALPAAARPTSEERMEPKMARAITPLVADHVPDQGDSPLPPALADEDKPLIALPPEPPEPVRAEPFYVYEVGSEETPPAEQNCIEQNAPDIATEPVATVDALPIEDVMPVFPYEVSGAAGTVTSGASAGPSRDIPKAPAGDPDTDAQPNLFERERTEKS
ncbi:MAG TPA: cyanophycin synthetase, partial [Terriglobia bacterium]|nr:cyanophycin synthetase [Terriglobia bacterium]